MEQADFLCCETIGRDLQCRSMASVHKEGESKVLKKVLKKVRRKQALFLKQEPELGVEFLEEPSHHVFIGNGGIQNGLSQKILLEIIGKEIVEELYMPMGKDYSFVSFTSVQGATAVVESLNGMCVQDICKERGLSHLMDSTVKDGPLVHLYLCHVSKIPSAVMEGLVGGELPPGLVLITEYISLQEEEQLLQFFAFSDSRALKECAQLQSSAYNEHAQLKSIAHNEHAQLKSSAHKVSTQLLSVDEGSTYVASLGSTAATVTDHGKDSERIYLSSSSAAVSGHVDNQELKGSGTEFPSPVQGFGPPEATLKQRRVMHYGYEFLYGSSNVDPNSPLPGGLPDICLPILRRMVDSKLVPKIPDQLTVNEYYPGAGMQSCLPSFIAHRILLA